MEWHGLNDPVIYGFSVICPGREDPWVAQKLIAMVRERRCRDRGKVIISFPEFCISEGNLKDHVTTYTAYWNNDNWEIDHPTDKIDQEYTKIESLAITLQDILNGSPLVLFAGRPRITLAP